MSRGKEPMSKVNLGLRWGLQIKMFLVILSLTMREVVVPNLKILFAQIVGKKHFGKCLASTSGCYGCGKNNHKVRDYPTIATRWRDSTKLYNGSIVGEQNKNHFYVLQANKEVNPEDGKL